MLLNMCPILDESRRSDVVTCLAITATLALASVIMRLTSRRIRGTKLWWDDYLIVFALVNIQAVKRSRAS